MKKDKLNIFAILGLIFSCTVSAILGIIFSILGLSEAKKNNNNQKVLATCGCVIGIVRIFIYILLIIVFIVFASSTNNDDVCKKSYDCEKGIFGNYECKYISNPIDKTESLSTCSKKQVDKYKLPVLDFSKEKIEILVFYGSGCPHCEHLFEYLDKLEQDPKYSKMFTVTKYDTWKSSKNLELLYKAQDCLNVEHSRGVPFFIIGDEYYYGFGDPIDMSDTEDKYYKDAIKDAYINGKNSVSKCFKQ